MYIPSFYHSNKPIVFVYSGNFVLQGKVLTKTIWVVEINNNEYGLE